MVIQEFFFLWQGCKCIFMHIHAYKSMYMRETFFTMRPRIQPLNSVLGDNKNKDDSIHTRESRPDRGKKRDQEELVITCQSERPGFKSLCNDSAFSFVCIFHATSSRHTDFSACVILIEDQCAQSISAKVDFGTTKYSLRDALTLEGGINFTFR